MLKTYLAVSFPIRIKPAFLEIKIGNLKTPFVNWKIPFAFFLRHKARLLEKIFLHNGAAKCKTE